MIDGTSKVVELLESAIKDAAHGQVPAQLLNLSLTRGEIQNVLLAVSEIDVLGDTVNSKLKTAMLERGSMCVSFIETFIAEERKSQKIPNVPAGAHYVDCSTCFPPFQSFGNLKIIQLDLMSNEAMNTLLLVLLLAVLTLSTFYRIFMGGWRGEVFRLGRHKRAETIAVRGKCTESGVRGSGFQFSKLWPFWIPTSQLCG